MQRMNEGSPTARKASPSVEGPCADYAVEEARTALVSCGAHVMPAAVTRSCLGVEEDAWERFRTHWDKLCTDNYAADLGVRRLRRYGQFSLTTEQIKLLPPTSFVQPDDSNPLYVGMERTFEPLIDSFVVAPLFRVVLGLLRLMATALEDPAVWNAKVHPFRVVASAEADGLPTPEGRHRDGVTLVSSLLIGRQNAVGGESSVFDQEGRLLLTTTLSEPGALLLADDRRTLHSVSPVRPVDRSRPAYRDVLVVTFTPG